MARLEGTHPNPTARLEGTRPNPTSRFVRNRPNPGARADEDIGPYHIPTRMRAPDIRPLLRPLPSPHRGEGGIAAGDDG